jgi:hypothetical protein
MQQYHARAEQMGSSHLRAIPGAVMETYGSAVRDYMSQVPASRRNDPNLSVEVVLATAYEHAKQLGGDPQAALARVIGDLNSRYNPNQVSQNQTVPPPRRAAALPATIPPGARQPSSSVASSAAVTPVRTGSKYEQSVKMLMDEGMSREDARLAVNGSKL